MTTTPLFRLPDGYVSGNPHQFIALAGGGVRPGHIPVGILIDETGLVSLSDITVVDVAELTAFMVATPVLDALGADVTVLDALGAPHTLYAYTLASNHADILWHDAVPTVISFDNIRYSLTPNRPAPPPTL